MPISYIAINRTIEQEAAQDLALRQQMQENGKRTLADGRALSDDQLLDKLRSLGLGEVDRDWLDRYSSEAPSAEILALWAIQKSTVEIPEEQFDWVWIALTCLWERWLPDRLSLEMVDDLVHAGYQAQEQGETLEAIQGWLRAWDGVTRAIQIGRLHSLVEFDERFQGTYRAENWVRELFAGIQAVGKDHPDLLRAYTSVSRYLIELEVKKKADRKVRIPVARPKSDRIERSQAMAEILKRLGEGEETEHEPSETELDSIIAELDCTHDGTLPELAIRAAQRCRGQITPRLIELIQQATQAALANEEDLNDGQLYALFLLAEFEAREALPAILDSISMPGELPFDLYGDTITEDLTRILAVLAQDQPAQIERLIADSKVNAYVRSAAMQVYLLWVRDGHLTRDEAVNRLHAHLRNAIAADDDSGTEFLVEALYPFAPAEAHEDIVTAFERGLIHPGMISLNDVDEAIAMGELALDQQLMQWDPTRIADTVEELRSWSSFGEEIDDDDWSDDEIIDLNVDDSELIGVVRSGDPYGTGSFGGRQDDMMSAGTIRRDTPRVGRNEPCPCGSGKKFKKCCGRH